MSRPMALALVLLVLFLTSQSEWRASRSQGDAFPALVTKQQRVEMHRDGVKEKIIMDLMAETKRLEADNRQLEAERHRLQQRVHRLELKLASLLGPADGVASAAAAAAAAAASAQAVAAGASDSRGLDGSSMNNPGLEDGDQTSLPSSSFSDSSQQSGFASASSSLLPSSFVTNDDDESSSLDVPSADAGLEKRVQYSADTTGRFASTMSEEGRRQRGRRFGTTRFEEKRGDEDDGDVRNEEDVALQLSRVFRGKQGSLGAAVHKVGPLRLGPPAPYGRDEGRLGKDGEGGGGLLSALSEHQQQHGSGVEEHRPFRRRFHQAVVVGGG